MDFDWQGMLDFVVSCEKQHSCFKEEAPVFPEDQIQYYPEDSYNVAELSQPSQTTDGSAFAVHSAPEAYGDGYPMTILPFNSYSPEAEQQNSYASFEDNFYEQQSSCYVLPQDYNAPPQGVFNLLQDSYEPPQEVPVNYNEHWQDIQQNVYPVQQQSTPSPESANVEASFPIRIEILGYVNQDEPQVTQRPATKSTTTRNTKLKTFTSDWNCAPCGRSFKSKGGLSQHNQQIHSGPTPHGCDICGKRFRDFEKMQQHRQRHLAKDKPFKCDGCPKQFFRLSDLQRHDDLHHGMRRFSCSICAKAFDRADHVKDHELSHVNGTVKKTRIHKRK